MSVMSVPQPLDQQRAQRMLRAAEAWARVLGTAEARVKGGEVALRSRHSQCRTDRNPPSA